MKTPSTPAACGGYGRSSTPKGHIAINLHELCWNYGNRNHHGNIILGRIALLDGNIDEAKSRLVLAGKTSGSPQLNSFGPNMLLAKELLKRGETAVVLEYFDLCKKFWTSANRDLEQWVDDVQSNRIPQFGGNLAY